jgi:F0F1-type ATP synthase gamma subunit
MVYFNYFKNTLTQLPLSLTLYPLREENFKEFVNQTGLEYNIKSNIKNKDLIIEPDLASLKKEIFRQLRNYLITSAIVQNKA